MKVEFFYRTARGATPMKFINVDLAKSWHQHMKDKHGKALPDMELVKQTTVITEEIYEPFSSTVCSGGIIQQVPVDASIKRGIQRM